MAGKVMNFLGSLATYALLTQPQQSVMATAGRTQLSINLPDPLNVLNESFLGLTKSQKGMTIAKLLSTNGIVNRKYNLNFFSPDDLNKTATDLVEKIKKGSNINIPKLVPYNPKFSSIEPNLSLFTSQLKVNLTNPNITPTSVPTSNPNQPSRQIYDNQQRNSSVNPENPLAEVAATQLQSPAAPVPSRVPTPSSILVQPGADPTAVVTTAADPTTGQQVAAAEAEAAAAAAAAAAAEAGATTPSSTFRQPPGYEASGPLGSPTAAAGPLGSPTAVAEATSGLPSGPLGSPVAQERSSLTSQDYEVPRLPPGSQERSSLTSQDYEVPRLPPGQQPGAPVDPSSTAVALIPEGPTTERTTGATKVAVAIATGLATGLIIRQLMKAMGRDPADPPGHNDIDTKITKKFFEELKIIIGTSSNYLKKKIESFKIINNIDGNEILNYIKSFEILKIFNQRFYKLLNNFINENKITVFHLINQKLTYIDYSKIINGKIKDVQWPSNEQINEYIEVRNGPVRQPNGQPIGQPNGQPIGQPNGQQQKKKNINKGLTNDIKIIINNLITRYNTIYATIDKLSDSVYNTDNFLEKISILEILKEFNINMYKLLNDTFKEDDYIRDLYYRNGKLTQYDYSTFINGVEFNKGNIPDRPP